MNRFILLAIAAILVSGCDSQKPYHIVKVDNPAFAPNIAFVGYEDLTSPKFKILKEKYQLDTIFRGETVELKRILLLRDWIRKHIQINDPGPHPGDGSCESILDHALKGSGYHCGHFMVVQNATMNAYGYITRCVGAGPGGQDGQDGHHGINEIWLNSYHKWFLSDAKYNSHFEKNGIPLSALEVREEYLKNRAADIIRVTGPGRTPVDADTGYNMNKEEFARTYTWLEWDMYNTRYTAWPNDSAQLIMYKDAYFTNHRWIWDGKPHWAYNSAYMNLVSDRKAIEWTPNTIASKVTIEGNKARIELTSNTPNLKTYRMRETPDENWKDVSSVMEIVLKKQKNEMIIQAVNIGEVSGPEHRILIEQ
ncbi:MAG TPA: transglutaminase-like domain-containing protein [Agriterribacter sp.]|nr:transglutaminase-like domain-containing protein [Agriterribacter sp.]